MTVTAKIDLVENTPVYQIHRTSPSQTLGDVLDQFKTLLSNDFFATPLSDQFWGNASFNCDDLEAWCKTMSDATYTFKDNTQEMQSSEAVSSQVLVALENMFSPLLTSRFEDIAKGLTPVKLNVDNHIDFANAKGITGRPGHFAEMASNITFKLPVHTPALSSGKSQPTLMHLHIVFNVAAEVNLVTGEATFKTDYKNKPMWDLRDVNGHFSMVIKHGYHSELNSDTSPHIGLIVTPLFYGLKSIGEITQRIHNMIALRIYKNQEDFSKLLSHYSYK